MFEIKLGNEGQVFLSGRLDASRNEEASAFLDEITSSAVLDLSNLEYISSAGLGVLVAAQKRLSETGGSLRIVNARNHIQDIFRFSGLYRIFEMD